MHYILGIMAIIVSPLILFGYALRALWREVVLYRRARSMHYETSA